jgi:lipoprotein-releasing system permease protein
MFHPLSLFVGLRYVRSRDRGFFVSFISWVSMLGVCLGVAALIVIISVMNGLERETRSRLLSLASHATISGTPAQMRRWPDLADKVRASDGVVGVAPYLDLQGMVGRGREMRPAIVRGVDPALEPQVSDFGSHMLFGQLTELRAGEQGIVLGSGIALALDARIGDEVTVLVPVRAAANEGAIAGIDIQPRLQTFEVRGVFQAGAAEHDNTLALIHLQDAASLAETDGAPGGLRLKFDDIFAAPERTPQIANSLRDASKGDAFTTSDWSIENATWFRAVRIEKTMTSVLLMLIVAVAAFNIVAALVMVVNEKRNDIAILRTVGMTPGAVVGVFFTQGIVIGWFGALLGCGLGVLLALNVETIVPAIENLVGVHIFDPNVYYITQVPSEVRWPQVAWITGIALVLTVVATIYPSRRGAATEPADALRYE